MTGRLRAMLVALVGVICCIPLVLGVLGATSGVVGAVGVWFRRYDLTVFALLGAIAFAVPVTRNRSHSEQEDGDR